ncbi:MAG: DUF4493 domain-containing protein [Alistipes sp.]|nr:DUF4493 domain-containing protein [Alistipes sp.]
MKKIFNILTYTVLALLAVASCTRPAAEENIPMAENEGVLALNINYGTTKTTEAEEQAFVLRIYRYTGETDENGAKVRELVRKYTAEAEVPEYIWLLNGNYCAAVEVGNKENTASFTQRYFTGESDFEITSGAVVPAEVVAKMQNVVAATEFDATVAAKFTEEYYVYVSAADAFDLGAAEKGEVPSLKFTESTDGYFLMPEECTTLNWYFYGSNGTDKVEQYGTIENVEALKKYTLKFKYSKDAPGFVTVTATVDTSVDYHKHDIAFSPDPTVKGSGFDVTLPYTYTSGERTYIVTALDTISQLNLVNNGTTFDFLSGSYAGVTVNKVNAKDYRITLAEEFFNSLPGGEQTLEFRIKDASGGVGYTEVVYNLQGVLPIGEDDYELWFGTADFRAQAFGGSNIQIGYRLSGASDWAMVSSSASGTENIYNASAPSGITAEKTYEYAMFVDSKQVGSTLTFTTPAGVQIPEAGFESWTSYGSNGIAWPTANVDYAMWDTGNHATKKFADNVTVAADDPRPGSTGSKCAYMHSTEAVIAFAAGNLFVGRFIAISNLGGKVDFGRPFEFNARPKALKFWMKNSQGQIDKEVGNPGSGTDMFKIFVALANRENAEAYHVDTGADPAVLFETPEGAPGVIAYNCWTGTDSRSEWTEVTLDLTYYDTANTVKPNVLVLTFTCSGYGDYLCGSTDSWMKIDDVEFVY